MSEKADRFTAFSPEERNWFARGLIRLAHDTHSIPRERDQESRDCGILELLQLAAEADQTMVLPLTEFFPRPRNQTHGTRAH